MVDSESYPDFAKLYLIGIWITTVLWAIKSGRNARHRALLVRIVAVVLFSLSTVHIAASLQQLLDAFIYVPDNATRLYATLYFEDTAKSLAVTKTVIFSTAAMLQNVVLTWRLYIVWEHSWKICVIPILIEVVHNGAAFAAVGLSSKPDPDIYSSSLKGTALTAYSMGLIFNLSATSMIAVRLWWMGRKVVPLTSSITAGMIGANPFMMSIIAVVESHALYAIAIVIMLALYVSSAPVVLPWFDITAQLAVMTPLMVVIRVRLGIASEASAQARLSTFRASGAEQDRSSFTNSVIQIRDVTSDSLCAIALEELKAAGDDRVITERIRIPRQREDV
ncbi:uncharacterized protein LAESUDRAFT_712441 [Laetiporus sulphureus 93-53]|uniref:Uncharacterized protein n=1 Tax=Laetiporus sulphureus 93-53 TaxID=1314785 RepID=A0A165FSL6_9APHY|nr:uncharacterized protein LAESUDRAFT_712441 [Laetiporus sulphureus 93-53]KZT09360.1 hypothetical protein LAESUDRAFT_712441 [Laetiporus sulphureus 93-53]